MTDQTPIRVPLSEDAQAAVLFAPEPGHRMRVAVDALLPVVFAALMLLSWEALVRLATIPPYILPAPSAFLSVLFDRFDALAPMALQTLRATLIGFACGVGIGLVLGALIGSMRVLYDMVYPSLVAFHTIPTIALIPLFVVWFGAGPHIASMTASLVCFFPVTVIVATAIAA